MYTNLTSICNFYKDFPSYIVSAMRDKTISAKPMIRENATQTVVSSIAEDSVGATKVEATNVKPEESAILRRPDFAAGLQVKMPKRDAKALFTGE